MLKSLAEKHLMPAGSQGNQKEKAE
jgi:hypothetical protein